jgi:hypothetical protein
MDTHLGTVHCDACADIVWIHEAEAITFTCMLFTCPHSAGNEQVCTQGVRPHWAELERLQQ